MTKPKWITIGTVEGSMNGSSEITAAAHTGRVAREGTITVTTAGGATDTTAVSQVGAAEVITIETKTYSVNAVGQNITIQGKSNSADLNIVVGDSTIPGLTYKLAVAGVTDESWNGSDDITVDGDPGADAIYDFTLTVTVPENKSESVLVAKFAVKNANDTVTSGEITINQAAGVKNYATPVITDFSYSTVGAWGGPSIPTVTYEQDWGWNESSTNGGTITGGYAPSNPDVKYTFTGSDKLNHGAVIFPSKGTTVSDITEVPITVTVTVNGKTSPEKIANATQAANTATYGEVTIGQATPVSLAAPGETYTIVLAMKQTVTYTSGATRTEATPADNKVQLSADYTVKTAKEGFSLETNTGKVTVNLNPTTAPREGFVVTISAEGEGGKTATKDITFNQQGSSSTLDISPDTMLFIAAGETKTLTITSNDSWTLS